MARRWDVNDTHMSFLTPLVPFDSKKPSSACQLGDSSVGNVAEWSNETKSPSNAVPSSCNYHNPGGKTTLHSRS